VDELWEAAVLTFEDSEELAGEKVYDRDTHRWELDPAPLKILRNASKDIDRFLQHSQQKGLFEKNFRQPCYKCVPLDG
jgi:hypothetical protein